MYKPLPNCLTIRKSFIHGLGLFDTEKIDKDVTGEWETNWQNFLKTLSSAGV